MLRRQPQGSRDSLSSLCDSSDNFPSWVGVISVFYFVFIVKCYVVYRGLYGGCSATELANKELDKSRVCFFRISCAQTCQKFKTTRLN